MSKELKENISGIYTCSCGNLVTHVQGNRTPPCGSCDKKKWNLICGTEEIELGLKEYKLTEVITTIRERFEKATK